MGVGVKVDGAMVLAAVAAVAGWMLWQKRNAFNPTSTENVIYQGVNDIGAAVTGGESFSLGTWIYELVHPGELEGFGLLPEAQTEYIDTADIGSTPGAYDIDWGA